MKSKFREIIKNILLKENTKDYSNYKTAIAILFYQEKILILQRGSTAPWMPNKWSLVGGVVDEGENPKQSVIREIKEEIGVDISDLEFIEMYDAGRDSGKLYYFVGNLSSDKIDLDYENQDYAFISQDEMNNYEFIPFVKDQMLKAFNSHNNI